MSWSINIGRIAGTAVRIHITFILFLGWIFVANYVAEGREAALTSLLFLVLLFVMPLITMRTYSEEKRSGTIELLLTAPLFAIFGSSSFFKIVGGTFQGGLNRTLPIVAWTSGVCLSVSPTTTRVVNTGRLPR